ncbi:glycosyl transferase [Treponema rectale]|uniref:Glycosyl transferase n=1 Tax=Treponema rectale TaxID=744512 RepID=A0A7M1XIS4_9SPIR|nr:glycosyl transferase [Treponema rectale]
MKKSVKRVFTKLLNMFAGLFSDKLFLKLKYHLATGQKLDLSNPTTFDEKLQYLKLYNHNPKYTELVDKFEVKKYVESLIGKEYVIPTIGIYQSFEEINFDLLPKQFVIKCTHDSGGLVVVKDKSKVNIESIKKKITKSLRHNYFKFTREWPYKNVKPRIIIEEYIELGSKENHYDYKFMCFNGIPKYLFLDVGVIGSDGGHADEYYRNIYDMNFDLQPFRETRRNTPYLVEKPKNFEKMVEIAAILSKSIPHVRVDLYNVGGKIYFGEITFFHGSGINNKFIPDEYSKKMGDLIDLSSCK